MLDIKKVYIDTRYKSSDSNSDSDFFVELPLAVNIPDKCICYVDDIVLPVSWTMIDDRNNQLHIAYRIGNVVAEENVTIPYGNYNGITFSNVLEVAMNFIVTPFETPVTITYDIINNRISSLLTDERDVKIGELEVIILTDKFIESIFSIHSSKVLSVNNVLMLKERTEIYPAIPKTVYLDMHQTRNLYLTSTVRGKYNTISNFGVGCIIKKYPFVIPIMRCCLMVRKRAMTFLTSVVQP